MTDDFGSAGGVAGSDADADKSSTEAKRLAARRRFLLGGATALPLIVTLGQREAWAASQAVCQSMGLAYDKKYAQDDMVAKSKAGLKPGGLSVSAFCNPI